MTFSDKDIAFLEQSGHTPQQVEFQLDCFRRGSRPIKVIRPATAGDGIIILSPSQKETYRQLWEKEYRNYSVTKFVPASGAASRMFRALYEWQSEQKNTPETDLFFTRLHDFAFYQRIRNYSKKNQLVEAILSSSGLNFGNLPKALLPFHHYRDNEITPLESHLLESLEYTNEKEEAYNVHFTFSPEHVEMAEEKIWKTLFDIEEQYGVDSSVLITSQHNETDTIAVDESNNPVREENGNLIFRPAGHGALLDNLSETCSDIVFIRNIDNILPPHKNVETVMWKKIMGGMFLQLRNDLFRYLGYLKSARVVSAKEMNEFCNSIFIAVPENLKNNSDALAWYSFLNRPMRLCGMVKNEGQPGGGPFWIKNENGMDSLQIVESAQFSNGQMEILNQSTHFNPNDIVCSFRSHTGEYFDLGAFVDHNAFFISEKSFNGKKIKALELPGLWNGGMAGWITWFVEIPSSVFNPVKTVNDLLGENHRS